MYSVKLWQAAIIYTTLLLGACGSDDESNIPEKIIDKDYSYQLEYSKKLASSDNINGIWMYVGSSTGSQDLTQETDEGSTTSNNIHQGKSKGLFLLSLSEDETTLTLTHCRGFGSEYAFTGTTATQKIESESFTMNSTLNFKSNTEYSANQSYLIVSSHPPFPGTSKSEGSQSAIKISEKNSFQALDNTSLKISDLTTYSEQLIIEDTDFSINCYDAFSQVSTETGTTVDNLTTETYTRSSSHHGVAVAATALDNSSIFITASFTSMEHQGLLTDAEGQVTPNNFKRSLEKSLNLFYSANGGINHNMIFHSYEDVYEDGKVVPHEEWAGVYNIDEKEATIKGTASNADESIILSLSLDI